MVVYLAGLFLSMFFCAIAKKVKSHRSLAIFLTTLPFGLISGFRWYVGTDFQSYIYAFNSIANGGTYGFEPLTVYLSRIASLVFNSVQGSFLVFSLFTIYLLVKTMIEESEIPELSIFLFFTLGYFFSSMNIVRQYAAISILFAANRFVLNKKWKMYLIFVAIAAGFHVSAIAAGILLACCGIKFSQKQYFGIGACAILFSFCVPQINKLVKVLFPKYAYVIDRNVESLTYQEIAYYVAILLPCLIVGALGYSYIRRSVKTVFLFNCTFFSTLIYVFMNGIPLINRLAIYSEIFLVLYVPSVMMCFKKKQRKFVLLSIIVLTSAAFVFAILLRNRYNVFPYQFKFVL